MRLFGRALAVSFFLLIFIGFAKWNLDWPFSPSRLQMSAKRLTATVRLKLPADFPTGLPAPLTATLEGEASGKSIFSLRPLPGEGTPVLAQRDPTSGKLWMIRGVEPSERASTLDFVANPDAGDSAMRINREPDGFLFSELERPILFYQETPKALDGKYKRANYAHPVYGLDGEILTQDFPDDHPHHRGVFWAWHQLLVKELRAGDPWETKNFLAVVRSAVVVDEGPVFATLKVSVLWTSPRYQDGAGRPQPIVEENSTIRVFRSSSKSQCLDFEIVLKPLVPGLRLGGSENSRGYSGFTVRVKPPLEGVLHDSIGTLVQDRIGEASPWADYSGRFGATDRVSGLAILSHPSLPEFPPKWVLRHYGMVNAAYPGQHAVPVPEDSLVVLRHRVVVHRGTQSQARIPDHQKIYETGWQIPDIR